MNSDKITTLKFPDAVRTHTSIFFSFCDYTEVEAAFLQMIGLFSEEAADGHSKEINIKISRDFSIEIQSNNRGLFLGSKAEGENAEWVNVFCKMYPEDKDENGEYEYIIGDLYTKNSYFATRDEKYYGMHLHQLNRYRSTLCQNQCVCEYMDVVSVRDGYERSLHFEKGYNIGGLTEIESDSANSTHLSFKYDDEVFENTNISYDFAKEQLHRLALLNTGVTFNLTYEAEDITHKDTFVYQDGVREYLEELLSGNEHTEIFDGECTYTGRDKVRFDEYTANLRILFTFCKDKPQINTFHNYNLLRWNGDHTDRAIQIIQKVLNSMNRGSKLTKREIKEHLVLFVVTNTSRAYSRWNEEGQRSLGNEMIVDMVSDAIDENFLKSMYCNGELINTVSSWIYEEREKNLFKTTDDYKLQFENALTDINNGDGKGLFVKCLLDMPRTKEYYDYLVSYHNNFVCEQEPLYYEVLLKDYLAFMTYEVFKELKKTYSLYVCEYLPRIFQVCEKQLSNS